MINKQTFLLINEREKEKKERWILINSNRTVFCDLEFFSFTTMKQFKEFYYGNWRIEKQIKKKGIWYSS
jgi:hypothetical protein